MKKLLLILFLGIYLFPVNVVMADDEVLNEVPAVEVDSTLGVHPYKKLPTAVDKYANWSLTFELGMSLLDADFNQPGITIVPKTRIRPSGAISLSYDFTPVWGLTGVYSYGNYGIKQSNGDFLIFGHMHSLELLLSYDLVDSWFPRRKTNIFSLYLLGGLGLGFYNSDLSNADGTIKHPRTDGKYDEVGMISVGLQAEFNVTREIGLGLKGMYHIYTNDMLDGKMQGTSNDCMEYASVYLRWKLEGRKKNHMRNFSSEDALYAMLPEKEQPAPLKDTLVMYNKDTIVIIDKEIEHQASAPILRHYVYFDNDRSTLTDHTLTIIQQFADLLQEDSTLCVELNGYCDNTGSEKHNEALAQRRAERVKKELMTVYGISEDRIVTEGKGMLTNVGSSYAPNRRVSIRFISQEECDSLRNEKEQPVKTDEANVEQPSQEPATVEQATEVVEEENDVLAVVTSKKDVTTLSRLAKQYYKNASCWPYIYEANTDVLSNPDFIPEGVSLNIPKVDENLLNPSNTQAMAQVHAMAAKYQNK